MERIEYEQIYDSSATNHMKMTVYQKDAVFTGTELVDFELQIEIACRFEDDQVLLMDAAIVVSCAYGRERMPFYYGDGSPDFAQRCRQLSEDVKAECEERQIHEIFASYIGKFIQRRIAEFERQFYMENGKMNPEYFQGHYYQVQFPVKRIILGGGSEGSTYSNLSAFLCNYANMTGGMFARYDDYTFLTIREGEIVDTKSQSDYRGYGASVWEMQGGTMTVFGTISEAGDAVEKNATSTVIKFVYAGFQSDRKSTRLNSSH